MELESARAAARASALLESKNRELRLTQPSAEELHALRADHETLSQLQTELSRLKRGADDRVEAAKRSPKLEASKGVWPNAGPELSSQTWRNAGRNTPAASFETTLWAAAGGDVDALAAGLLLSDPTQVRALLAELPPEERAKYTTPERLIATLMAKDVTAHSIQVLDQVTGSNPDNVDLTVRLNSSGGAEKQVTFNTYHVPDGWKLVVPKLVLTNYVNLVRGTAASPSK